MAKRAQQTTLARRARRPTGTVVDLSSVRAQKRRELAGRRVQVAMDDNRAALRRLFASGLIFTQKGARAGRDLLGAHQSLLRLAELFARLVEPGARADHVLQHRAEEAFRGLDGQLLRAAQLTARAGEFVAGRGRE